MTFHRLTTKTVALALAIAALGVSSASATPTSSQERQAIASRGIGAPTPPVVLGPGGSLPGSPLPAAGVAAPQAKSSDGTDWAVIALIAAFAVAAVTGTVAMLTVGRRHTAATPR